jgi:hypothetical protein
VPMEPTADRQPAQKTGWAQTKRNLIETAHCDAKTKEGRCPQRRGGECYGVARRPRDPATLPRGPSMVQICVPCEVMHEAMS